MNKTGVRITIAGPQDSGTLILARAILELLQGTDIEGSMPEEAENPTDGDSIEALGYLTREVGPLRVTVQTSNELEVTRDRTMCHDNPIDKFVEMVGTTLAAAKQQLSAEAHYNTLVLAQNAIEAALAAWREENPT